MNAENPTAAAAVSRRGFMVLAAGGVGGLLATGGGAQGALAATPAPSPTLPGEYYRKANQLTPAGTLFDNICVRINGDVTRLHVPQSVKPGAAVPVVWFYHGAGSDHNALDGGFKTSAASVVDSGGIAVCQTAGGTLYSHPKAQAIQVAGYSWISGIYTVTGSTLRATSGGGALACETYAAKLIPNIIGMYNVNAVYDIEALYTSGGEFAGSVIAAFGDDPAAIAAANPARHPTSAWTGAKLRVIVSQPNSSDLTVPPAQHGLKLLSVASPTAAEASLKVHATGHATPSFSVTDFQTAARRWNSPTVDTSAPVVSVTSPAAGAAATGALTLTAAAGDNINVATVVFSVGGVEVPARMNLDAITVPGQPLATAWIATVDTARVPNGPAVVTATAKDPTGNTTTSAPVTVSVFNADTAPPSVVIVSPATNASVSGVVTVVVEATDDVGVASVAVTAGGVDLGAATLQSDGRWAVPWNTSSAVDGATTLTAVATDAAGNVTTSAAIPVTVANRDTTAPTVAIVSPASGATVKGVVTATISATDNVGVTSVGVYAGTRLAGWATDQGGGVWTLVFNTRTSVTPNGVYVLTARATDAAGNVGVSPATSVTIKN